MKKAIAIIVSILFVFAVTSISFAAEKAAPAPAKMEDKKAPAVEAKKVKSRKVSGDVAAVDAKANTITVKGKKAETTVICDDKSKVVMGKEAKTCADVKVGDRVLVTYSEADGKNMAKKVKIEGAKPAEKKEKAEKKAASVKPTEKK